MDPHVVLGGFPPSSSNYSGEATSFVVTLPLSSAAGHVAAARAWEEAFVQLAKGRLTEIAAAAGLSIAFSTERWVCGWCRGVRGSSCLAFNTERWVSGWREWAEGRELGGGEVVQQQQWLVRVLLPALDSHTVITQHNQHLRTSPHTPRPTPPHLRPPNAGQYKMSLRGRVRPMPPPLPSRTWPCCCT